MRPSDVAFDFEAELAAADPEVAALVAREVERNRSALNLIASESDRPRATIEAEASILVTKNATGYPGSRKVAGCEVFDDVEALAIERAKRLFGAEHANVRASQRSRQHCRPARTPQTRRPHPRPRRDAGGHHSHGASYHLSGQDYEATHFGVSEEAGGIDVAAVRTLVERVRPRIMIVGSTAIPRALPFAQLAAIAREVGAYFFADIAHVVGLVVAGLHENPAPVSDVVTSSTHKTFCGPRTGGLVLCKRQHAKAIDDAIFPAMQGAPGAQTSPARRPLRPRRRRGLSRADACRSWRQSPRRLPRGGGISLYLGGTDTHMVILDLRERGIDGRAAERRLERYGLIANRVTLPEKPGARSRVGIRLGQHRDGYAWHGRGWL